MNAILSLCHFCELHGPKVIFNTQAFRDPPSLSFIELSDESSVYEKNKEEFAWKYGRIDKDEPLKCQPSFLMDTCAACRSFPHNQAAIITNDNENRVSFVSSQYPFREEVFTSLRQAGIRSLSCEVYSEREGPIYFGDQSRGHVISYTFFLKDIQARGFLRRYSILVMMADKMFLLNSWSFFIKYIQEIIRSLQELACKVYSTEDKQNSLQKGLKPPVASSDNSKRHRAAGNPRPLTDLVGDPNIWTVLHTKFSWILNVGGVRLQEKLVEGPPLLVPEIGQQTITLQSLVSVLTSAYFEKMLHHLYIGDRVIFESSNSRILSEIPLVLKPIIPLYLFHPHHMTSDDDDVSDDMNIITLSPSPTKEKLFRNAFTVHLEAVNDEQRKEKCSLIQGSHVTEYNCLMSRPPQIVSKICSLIENGRFSNSVLNLYFATLIDEWTNKIKIWSFIKNEEATAARSGHAQHKPSSISSVTLSPERKGTPSLSLPFSPQNGTISVGGGHHLHLTVVGALECDIPMLNVLAMAYKKYSQS